MKTRCLALSLAMAICPIAEGLAASESPSPDPATGEDVSPADTGSGSNSVDPIAPSGELLRLSKLPEAELTVKVTLVGNDAHANFEIATEQSGATLLQCEGTCRFEIWPGTYRLKAVGSSGYLSGSTAFVVDRNADVRVTQSPVLRRIEGIVLTLIGIAGMATGATLLLENPCSNGCASESYTHHRAAFVAFSAGAVLAPIGWMLVMQSLNPHVEVIPHD